MSSSRAILITTLLSSTVYISLNSFNVENFEFGCVQLASISLGAFHRQPFEFCFAFDQQVHLERKGFLSAKTKNRTSSLPSHLSSFIFHLFIFLLSAPRYASTIYFNLNPSSTLTNSLHLSTTGTFKDNSVRSRIIWQNRFTLSIRSRRVSKKLQGYNRL